MRKTRTTVVLLLPLALAACQNEPEENASTPAQTVSSYLDRVHPRVWTDVETGCQYLIVKVKEGYAITPRIGADAKPLCSRSKGEPRRDE
ncbi:DUF6440 family protein [Microvirga massiliensis]|uniref:DUF6440 family protein n=1 Tax=Microvirga massiliensis TaxID=1033741 RepID=UPI00062BC90A|nr:DUF6440 family protein [Microvirga massiliensis]